MKPTTYEQTAAEQFTAYGPAHISDRDLLTLLGVKPDAAASLLQECRGQLAELAKLTAAQIERTTKGIGQTKARTIAAAFEIGRRREQQQARRLEQICTSHDAYTLLAPTMRDEQQEIFKIIVLDRRSKVLSIDTIHRGGVAAMVVDAKVIFRTVLDRGGVSVILAHNHPSGHPSPSMEDMALTTKLKNAGTFLDIKVLDHIVIGEGAYYSFADEGQL